MDIHEFQLIGYPYGYSLVHGYLDMDIHAFYGSLDMDFHKSMDIDMCVMYFDMDMYAWLSMSIYIENH